MLQKRIAPCLILNNQKLIHRSKFDKTTDRYIGDPINAVNIFNDYTVDEMFVIDITATEEKREVNFNLIKDIAGEAFFPLSYGGGIKNVKDAERIIRIGYEKIILNSEVMKKPNILKDIKEAIGSQSIVVSVDIFNSESNYYVYDYVNKRNSGNDLKKYLNLIQEIGIGEILITSVNLDGTMRGCDINLIKFLENDIKVPLIYKGGSASLEDIKKVVNTGANVFASSTIFIMKKLNGGIVFSYPSESEKQNYGIM